MRWGGEEDGAATGGVSAAFDLGVWVSSGRAEENHGGLGFSSASFCSTQGPRT
jgi:hypothetical protein